MADQPSIFDAFVAESPSRDDKIRSRKCWATYRYLFDPGFAAFVDDMLAEAPLTDHFNSMDAW
jgi:hypothetical protein